MVILEELDILILDLRKDGANIQTLPSPSDKRPSTGHTVDLVAHHVSSSGKSER